MIPLLEGNTTSNINDQIGKQMSFLGAMFQWTFPKTSPEIVAFSQAQTLTEIESPGKGAEMVDWYVFLSWTWMIFKTSHRVANGTIKIDHGFIYIYFFLIYINN